MKKEIDKNFKEEIVKLTLESIDKTFNDRTNKDTEGNVLIMERIRNNETGRDEDGNITEAYDKNKNKLSGKAHAQNDGISSKCLYDALYRLKIIEKLSDGVLGIIEEGWTNVHEEYLATLNSSDAGIFVPIVGIVDGSLYITETHEFYSSFTELLTQDMEYAECSKKYNEAVMGRKSLISRQEKKYLYNALNIPFTKYELSKIVSLRNKKDKRLKLFNVSDAILKHIVDRKTDKYGMDVIKQIREVL